MEHTPTEWAAQVAAADVVPLRDSRDDLRMALAALTIAQSNQPKAMSDGQAKSIVHALTTYMEPRDKVISPAETKQMLGGRRG